MVNRIDQTKLNWPKEAVFHDYGRPSCDPCTQKISVTTPELGEIIFRHSIFERLSISQVEQSLFQLYQSRMEAVKDWQQYQGKGYY